MVTRRRLLRSGATLTVAGLAGCTDVLGGSEVRDTDGDGVVDSQDYAPRDPEVQRREQVRLVEDEAQESRTAEPAAEPTARTTGEPTAAGTTPTGSQFEFAFEEGQGRWTFGQRPDDGARSGQGSWSSEHSGSLRLDVDGAPSSIRAWRPVGPLEAGTRIEVAYSPQRFAYEEATLSLNLRTPSGEQLRLDEDRDAEAGGYEQDGTLSGEVPRDLPEGTEVDVKLSIWPGDTTVWIHSVVGT